MYTKVSDMPFLMTTREVAAALRTTTSTFSSRRRTGRYKIEPVDRGGELLYDRRDVLRLMGRTEEAEQPSPLNPPGEPQYRPGEPQWGVTDPEGLAAIKEQQRRSLKPKRR